MCTTQQSRRYGYRLYGLGRGQDGELVKLWHQVSWEFSYTPTGNHSRQLYQSSTNKTETPFLSPRRFFLLRYSTDYCNARVAFIREEREKKGRSKTHVHSNTLTYLLHSLNQAHTNFLKLYPHCSNSPVLFFASANPITSLFSTNVSMARAGLCFAHALAIAW